MNTDQPSGLRTDGETPLNSWKEIGAYLQRNSATARRWEKEEGLPIHRHSHKSRSSVYAYPSEIEAWKASRKIAPEPAPPRPLWKIPAFALTMVLCLIMVGNGVRPVSAQRSQTLTARQIQIRGFVPGSFSRDGRFVAGSEWERGAGDLIVRDFVTGRDKILQTGACGKPCVFADTPVLSPDLKRVAYTWYDDRENEGRGQLRIIDNKTGAMPRVLVRTAELSTIWPSAWSPDGKSILVSIRENDRTWWKIAWVRLADGATTVLKTFHLTANERLSRPSLSPNGDFIAYSAPAESGSPTQHVFLLSSVGRSEIALTKGAGVNENPAWALDGKHLLFASDQSGTFDLWSMEVRAGKPTGSAELVKRDVHPHELLGITASGSLFYEITRRDTYDALAEIRHSDGAITLGNTEKFIGFVPEWSPDRKSIAFARVHPGRLDAVDLVIRTLATGEERIYSREGMSSAPPNWSRDGKGVLVAVANKKNEFSFYRLDLASGTFAEIIAADPEYWAFARLSPDGHSLYISARNTSKQGNHIDHVLAYDLETKQRKPVFSQAEGILFWFSPDGRRIGIRMEPESSDANGQTRFAIANADGSDYHEIYSVSDPDISTHRILWWGRDGHSLFFGKTGTEDQGSMRIMELPIERGQPEFTGLLVPANVQAIVGARDGSHIALISQETMRELWALDNVASVLK